METLAPSTGEELDDEFDQYLVNMKPFVLRLSRKSERQRCANWIKKLCEPPGSGLPARKNRNLYGKLLLHMLKKGQIDGPFTHRPEPGSLPTLPAYMSSYFDEPSPGLASGEAEPGARHVPDWLQGELSDNYSSSSRPEATSTLREHSQNLTASYRVNQRRTRTENGVASANGTGDGDYPSQVPRAREEPRSRHRRAFTFSSDEEEENRPIRTRKARSPARIAVSDGNTERQSFDWRLPSHGVSGPTLPLKTSLPASSSLGEETMAGRHLEKELELRTKVLEARFHEEKLGLQQVHDHAIQKILDRKNSEMEDMKAHYRSKTKEMDDVIRKMERRAQSLTKESTMVRESKDQQIAELKKMVEHTDQSTQNEYETKLHEATAQFELEKFDMQKQHTRAIQEILADTNARLHKMEMEYCSQVDTHADVIRALEERVAELSQETESQSALQGQLGQEKADLEARASLLSSELAGLKSRYADLEHEAERLRGNHDAELRSMRSNTDASIEFMKQEHSLSAAKSTETIRELEQHVQDLKKSLQDSEHQRQREIRDLESVMKQDRMRQENLQEKQLNSLKAEIEQERQVHSRKTQKLQQAIRDKEEEVGRLADQRRQQVAQSEKALEDFKRQAQHNSGRMFDDMKARMVQVEADLQESKKLRQTQSQEFAWQLEQESKRSNKQRSEMELLQGQKLAQLQQQHQAEREALQQEHERSLSLLTERLQGRLEEEQRVGQQQRERDGVVIGDLEQEVRELREANLQSNAVRKQQLVEMGLLREEEKQKADRDLENAVSQLQSEIEQQRLRMQKDHSAAMEQTLHETNARLRDIEADYTERMAKSSELVRQMKNTIETLKQDASSSRSSLERQMTVAISKLEDEKDLVQKQHSAYLKTLHEDLDKQRGRARQAERQLQQRDFQHQDQMTHLKQDYETKMRGLMPLRIRQELEDTIESLRCQVTTLQQKNLILEEEVENGR